MVAPLAGACRGGQDGLVIGRRRVALLVAVLAWGAASDVAAAPGASGWSPLQLAIFAICVALLVAGAAVIFVASPQRLIRQLRHPRLIARAEALARALVERGWELLPPGPNDPPTSRNLARADPRGERVALRVGCSPKLDWCVVEVRRECGLGDEEGIVPALTYDRDGAVRHAADLLQDEGVGFVVYPTAARERVPPWLVEVLRRWPARWTLSIRGGLLSIRADVAGAAEIEALVAEVLARTAA